MVINLNISNYNKEDILELFGLNSNEQITLDKLSQSTFSILQDINNYNQPYNEKIEIKNFIVECLEKICNIEKLIISSDIKNKLNNILNNYTNSIVIEQNDNQIIKKESDFNINSFPLRFKQGVINPLKKQTFNYILNINTKFRKNYDTTDSTNYILSLPTNVKNVLSMRLIATEIPNTYYHFSKHLGTNEFTINIFDNSSIPQPVDITITDGNYNGIQLQNYLNNIFSLSPFNNRIQVEFSPINGKIRFFKNEVSTPLPNFNFDLDFTIQSDPQRNIMLNMGWLLGFRKSQYTFSNDYIDILNANTFNKVGYNSEGPFDCHTTKYILLHINDFNKNHTTVLDTPLQYGIIRSSDILAKIPVFNNNYFSNVQSLNPSITNKRQYFGPVDIEKLEIRIYDEMGRIISLNNCDYSFSLELECLYDL